MPVFRSRSISARLFRLVVRGSLFLSANFDGQSCSAFSTAASQYASATLGGHPRPKAVVVDHFFVRRLKCSFHSMLTLKIQVWQYNKKLSFVKNINPRTKKPPQKDVGFLLRVAHPEPDLQEPKRSAYPHGRHCVYPDLGSFAHFYVFPVPSGPDSICGIVTRRFQLGSFAHFSVLVL